MKTLPVVVLAVACLIGCGARSIHTAEGAQSLVGYVYAPRSALCATQAGDPSLPDFEAALDTIIADQPASELLIGGFDRLCAADAAAPITSFALLQAVSDIGCTRANMRGCLQGDLAYTVTGSYQQTTICALVAKGQPPACRVGEVFVPTSVTPR